MKKKGEIYLDKLKEELFGTFLIVEYKNIGSPLIIQDKDGILYRYTTANQFFKNKNSSPTMQIAIDKNKAFQIKLNKVHPNLVLISDYVGFKEKVIVKDELGFRYSVQAYDLLRHPVTIQSCIDKNELFIYKANKKHNNLYEYPNLNYVNGKQKIDILCKKHGLFKQKIESHLYGNGCRKCASENCGFTLQKWLSVAKNKEFCILYVLELNNNEENFIKIGITTRNINQRYTKKMPYSYKVLDVVGGDATNIYKLEKILLKVNKKNKYIPLIFFEGITECLNIKCYTDVKNRIEEEIESMGNIGYTYKT